MLQRAIQALIQERLRLFPAVVLVGPRQCGKTTLAQALGGIYLDCQLSGDVARLDAEWPTLTTGDRLLILDEVQEAPEVISRLRSAIDGQRNRRGRFLLLGSVAPALMSGVSESLAGRMSLIRLAPFTLSEVGDHRLDDLWLYGGFPDGGILEPSLFPVWQNDYIEALATRDLPLWGLTSQPRLTLRLLAMLGAEHGQIFNASKLGSSLGVDHKTVSRICDHLEGAFLLRRLQPWSGNIRKRLVRRPKLYWRDSGLLHASMMVSNRDQLYRQPWLGTSWEGMVIEQTLAHCDSLGLRVAPYFFRSSDGYEIDLVLEHGSQRWAIEIKLTSNPTRDHLVRLNTVADLINADRRFLICRVDQGFGDEPLRVCNLREWLGIIATWHG